MYLLPISLNLPSALFSIILISATAMITNQYKNRSEHLIYQRRAQQEKLDTLNGKLKQEFHHKEFAKWENKGSDVEKGAEIKRRLQELRDDAREGPQLQKVTP